jgi:hypothetical protein
METREACGDLSSHLHHNDSLSVAFNLCGNCRLPGVLWSRAERWDFLSVLMFTYELLSKFRADWWPCSSDAWTGPFFQCPSPLPAQPLYLPWGAPHQGCKRCDMISLNYAPLPCVSGVELTHQEDLSLSYLGR